MSKVTSVTSHEYKNEYLYVIIRQAPELGQRTYIYCCGINTTHFDPICWGKAGICSNPAFKGLQQMCADVSGFALKKGFSTRADDGVNCGAITPKGDGWYRDSMLITGASHKDIQSVLLFSVQDLVKTVLYVCAPDAKMSATLQTPPALQTWLDSFRVKDYVHAAPPPIARKRDQEKK